MIKVTGIADFILDTYNVVTYNAEEHVGLELPICLLTVEVEANVLRAVHYGQKITVTVLTDSFSPHSVEYELRGYNAVPTSSSQESYYITLQLIKDYQELSKEIKQEYYNDSIPNVLEKLGFIVDEAIPRDTGKQIWIRPNTSAKYFIRQLTTHLFIGEDDCPLTAITNNKRVLLSLKKLMNMKIPKFKFINATDSSKDFITIKFLGKSPTHTLISSLHPASSVQPYTQKMFNKMVYYGYNGKELKTTKDGGVKLENPKSVVQVPKVDTGNTYVDYNRAEVRNKSAWVSFQSDKIFVKVGWELESNMRLDINLLDTVDFYSAKGLEPFSGRWIVTARYLSLEDGIGATHLELSRVGLDYFEKEVRDGG